MSMPKDLELLRNFIEASKIKITRKLFKNFETTSEPVHTKSTIQIFSPSTKISILCCDTIRSIASPIYDVPL
jgi:hypothetical protein